MKQNDQNGPRRGRQDTKLKLFVGKMSSKMCMNGSKNHKNNKNSENE